jgi:phosphoesterase RecJ-like protein
LIDEHCISTTQVLYHLFRENKIVINKKMATALYAGLVENSNGFMNSNIDGTTFAFAHELISLGAEYKVCHEFIMNYQTLAGFRLKCVMQTNMELFQDGSVAIFCVRYEDMQKTGAVSEDCKYALEEALYLPTVRIALLLEEKEDLSLRGFVYSKNQFDISQLPLELESYKDKNKLRCHFAKSITFESAKTKILKLIKEI